MTGTVGRPMTRGPVVRFFSFHLMPYPGLPPDYDGPAWITCPNEFFDPALGGEIYNRYIDELLYAEEAGFDGVCVNEHHQNAYGIMPSPNLIASILARQTKRVRIAVVGNALPLYDPPTRVAEEFAMIDCISGGRLIAGMVVGGGPEYYSFSMNPAHARERFAEAHDLIIKAWTEPGPFEYIGKHYKLRYVNTWPRPVQQPHPEIWIPGVGSLETLEFVAKHRYAYMGIPYFHISVFERMFSLMREACRAEGYEADPSQLGWLVPIFVAETDAEARKPLRRPLLVLRAAVAAGHQHLPAGLHVGEIGRERPEGGGDLRPQPADVAGGGRRPVRHRRAHRTRSPNSSAPTSSGWGWATSSVSSSSAPCRPPIPTGTSRCSPPR